METALAQTPKFSWLEPHQSYLAESVHQSSSNSNLTFICSGREKVNWNGLAYLGSVSHVFKPRSGEVQRFTVLLLDYSPVLVRKLLLMLSSGLAYFREDEVPELTSLVSHLGVSLNVEIPFVWSTAKQN